MPDFTFDNSKANKALAFFEKELQFVEGQRAGTPFALEEWQKKIISDLFGWLREDGTRRYRTAFIEVPRGNGKSMMMAGLALYLLLRDGEKRPQVYSAGGDRGQARIVFQAAREMVSANTSFQEEAELRQYQIRANAGGWYEALSAEAYTKHGLSAHGIIFDELHVQPNRNLWDVLLTSTGKRHQPLTVAITTAGHDRSSICWEMHKRAKAALENPEADPYFYAAIWDAEPGDDWTDEDVWRKANPNLGISVKLEYLREMCQAALQNPEIENTFRNLHLNQWTEQAVRWIPMHLWDKCRVEFSIEELKGRTCFAGLDLASTMDVSALALIFPEEDGTYKVVPHFWIPEKSKSDRAHQDRQQVLNWASKGVIEATSGNVQDYYVISDHIENLMVDFDVREFVYDKHGPARVLMQILEKNGVSMERFKEFSQTAMNFAAPSKEFHRLVASGKLHHDGNPVLRWMAGNVAAKRDLNDNVRPDKEASADKIDGIVATIMALGSAMNSPPEYEFNPGSLRL
jgi:phage terminase large subunit-like protein